MPYIRCPVCGEIAHLNVADADAWYRERYPNVPDRELVPAKCVFCWSQVSIGDGVQIRRPIGSQPQAESGARGVIEDIYSSKDGDALFVVRLASGETRFLVRGEIRKEPEQPNQPDK